MYPITYAIARVLGNLILHDDEHAGGEGAGGVVGGTLYNRGELAALVRLQYEERSIAKQRRKHNRVTSLASAPDLDISDIIHSTAADVRALQAELLPHRGSIVPTSHSIDGEEITMIEGSLTMKVKTAIDIYLSCHKVFCISDDMVLDDANIFTIYATGYNRIPLFFNGDTAASQ